ncbi:MAG TPA: nitroreductase family protein [Thermoanaerobaculia bacterium]|nr:nitroreductase family protein [Thermoanaerobaculia bacterium]
MTQFNSRTSDAPVDPMFLDRWSPRAFLRDPISEEVLSGLFEAARWSPSCFNEQPWLFMYADRSPEIETYRSILVPKNLVWAGNAPVLSIVFGARRFAKSGKENRWHGFDAGSAWTSLALAARRAGLYTHAMAGFDEEKAYELLGVPKADYEAMAAIVIGRRADPAVLPEDVARNEKPNDRKPLAQVAKRGFFMDGV